MTGGWSLVSGGSGGIGWAIVEGLRQAGQSVIVLDRAPPPQPERVDFVAVDLADPLALEEALGRVTADRIVTRLVNNVAIAHPAMLEDTRLADFDAAMAVNARCAMQCAQAVLPSMKAARFGRIVNISSRAALGKELRTSYAATKGALNALTRTWALELAPHGITVNAVAPGPINTAAFAAANPGDSPRTRAIIVGIPVQRMGQPEDVAHAVSFFLDDASAFITGQILYVCGGVTIGLAPA